MTLNEAKLLVAGTVVWWDDPDCGTCSRLYTIKTVTVRGNIVSIEEPNGDFLECLPKEISLTNQRTPRKFKVKICWNMEGEVEVLAYSKGHAIIEAIDAPLPSAQNWT